MSKLKCCICNLEENSKYKVIDKYNLLRCNNCGLVYLDRNYSEQNGFINDAKKNLKNENIEKVEYWSFPQLYRKYKKVFERFFKERLKRIKKYHQSPKTLFDIGCGYGFWMDYCKRNGITAEGIDVSPESTNYVINTFKLKAWNKDLMNFKTNKEYDVILMFDVIEHLENPNEALHKCKELLKKDGLLYLQVPNLIGFRIPLHHGYGLPYHLWQFNFKTLSKLLKKNGYKVIGHWTGPMGVVGEYEKDKHILFKEIMWKIASKLYLGNRLQVIAKISDN